MIKLLKIKSKISVYNLRIQFLWESNELSDSIFLKQLNQLSELKNEINLKLLAHQLKNVQI